MVWPSSQGRHADSGGACHAFGAKGPRWDPERIVTVEERVEDTIPATVTRRDRDPAPGHRPVRIDAARDDAPFPAAGARGRPDRRRLPSLVGQSGGGRRIPGGGGYPGPAYQGRFQRGGCTALTFLTICWNFPDRLGRVSESDRKPVSQHHYQPGRVRDPVGREHV